MGWTQHENNNDKVVFWFEIQLVKSLITPIRAKSTSTIYFYYEVR